MRGGAAATARLVAARATPRPTTSRCSRRRSRSTAWPPSASPGSTARTSPRTRSRSRCAPRRTAPGRTGRTMPYHDEHGPDAGSDESRRTRPGTDPVVVGDVDDVQVKAVTESGDAPDGMQLAIVDPGAQTAPPVEKPAIDTGTLDLSAADTTTDTATTGRPPSTATDRPRRTDPADRTASPTGPGDRRTADPVTDEDASLAAGGGHRQAEDLLAGPVGRRRADARQVLAALRRGARRLRAPHGEREQLHRGPGARDHPRHLRLPHPVPGLERRRLQLPRRPLRPDLGGPVRRRRPARRRRAHARLQRRRVRDVGDRQLRDRPAVGRDARRLRPAVRLEAQPARRERRRRRSSG